MAVSRGADGAMRIEGGCHCGAIAFAAAVDPDNVRICHCTDCQTLTGSAYRANVPALAGTFVLRRGAPKIYVKTAESGTRRARQLFAPPRHAQGARIARPQAPDLVPLGAALGDGSPHDREIRPAMSGCAGSITVCR